MLSEKDLKVSMKNVTSAWYDGRVFKHPETENMVKFWALPKDERNRLNQMVKKKQQEESQPSVPGATPVSPSKRPKQIRPKVLKRRKELEEPKKTPKPEEKKIEYPHGFKEGDKIKKKWCDQMSNHLRKNKVVVDLWSATKGDVKHILEVLDFYKKDNPVLYNSIYRAFSGIEDQEKREKEDKNLKKIKDKIDIIDKPKKEPEDGQRTKDFKKLDMEKIKNLNSIDDAKVELRERGITWKEEEPIKDKEGNIAEIHFKDKDGKVFGYWLKKRKELVLNNKMLGKEPKPVQEKAQQYYKDFIDQAKELIPAGVDPENYFEEKDKKRIQDIMEKARGDSGKEGRLAITQANRIGGAFKAFRRYNAAKAAGNKHVAFIFRERFLELARAGIFLPNKIKRPEEPHLDKILKVKRPKKPVDVEVSDLPKFDHPIFNTERDKKMQTMKVTNVEWHGGGINETFKIDFNDGTQACFKPEKAMDYGTPKHEVFASGLNRFLGYNELVPPTVLRKIPGKGTGSAQQWRKSIMPGDKAKHDFFNYKESKVPVEELAQSWMMDFLMVNTDRHNGNWLVDKKIGKDGKRHMHLIDNGLCLSKHRSLVIKYWELQREDEPKFEKLVQKLEKIEPKNFKEAFGKVLSVNEMKHMMKARDLIIKNRNPRTIKRKIEDLQHHWSG